MNDANDFYIMRKGLPLPAGYLRQTYTENELCLLIAEKLRKKGTTMSLNVLVGLPHGAKKQIKEIHGSLINFVIKYPQFFSIICDEAGQGEANTLISLIAAPTPE